MKEEEVHIENDELQVENTTREKGTLKRDRLARF
jgi:hypothetical protein